MSILTTKLIINVTPNSTLTTLPRFRIPLRAPNTLRFSFPLRTRIWQLADVLLCCLSLARIQTYLRIIISLELSVLLTTFLAYIPQAIFQQFFRMASFSVAVATRSFPVICRALGPCFLVNLESYSFLYDI